MDNRSLRMFIYILDDDSLIHIFRFCRPVMIDEDAHTDRILEGGEWIRERWWYKLTHVCRRWRSLILASASHLSLSLHCTYDTPVADMLSLSRPLPLIIDYLGDNRKVTTEEEDGIMFVLQLRHRIRRIRLRIPFMKLQKLIQAMDEEFPILEYLYIMPPTKHDEVLVLPKTFQAPHLRHFVLRNFSFPIRSPLLTTTVGLATLSLGNIDPSTYLCPNDLIQQLSLLPQLEILGIGFHTPFQNRNVEMRLLHRPITTHVALPNLRWFGFRGVSAYLDALLPRMTVPVLERLQIQLPLQLSFSIPHLLQFMGAAEHLRLSYARFYFSNNILEINVYPRIGR
jgi:hypothetical protein